MFLHAALCYASLGWHIFPLEVGSKRPRRGSHGLLEATADVHQVREWWEGEYADCNIGIACGPSNLLVVDIDPRNGGELTWLRFAKDHPTHPLTTAHFAEVHTPNGGTHYYYLVDKESAIRKTRMNPGVDIQARGGYVVAPPSVVLTGTYTWVVPPPQLGTTTYDDA